jgi:hypothetical protein
LGGDVKRRRRIEEGEGKRRGTAYLQKGES